MSEKIKGRVWVLGDDINTDMLAPGAYMKAPIETLAEHCLEALWPDFSNDVRQGDILLAGDNFGAGSSREQAAEVLQFLGLSLIVARSFAGIFFRNTINLGMPAMTAKHRENLQTGDVITTDLATGCVYDGNEHCVIRCNPLPQHLVNILNDGGLIPHLKKRLAA